MILSDRDIKKLIEKKKLVILPFEQENIGPCSIDLRLGNIFRLFKSLDKTHIDPMNPEDPEIYTEKKQVNEKGLILHPGEFVLGTTIERVKIPNNFVARLDGRSSWGRLGIIIHSTAGFIDSGFEGTITLEITNIGKVPVTLYPGSRICQMSLHKMTDRSMLFSNSRIFPGQS